MLRISSFCKRCFTTFSARTRWPVKEAQYSKLISTDIYQCQTIPHKSAASSSKTWTNLDNPAILITKEPHLDIFFNKIMQDISNRYQVLNGTPVICNYGLNCYGLQVLESLMDTTETMSPELIREKCRAFASEAVANYEKACKKWGVLCDDKSHYSTMDRNYEAAVAEGFSQLWRQSKLFGIMMNHD